VTAVIEAEGLGKRYRRQWALTDCSLSIPAGTSSAWYWGAPLIARELETGTSRLTWNQSITRARWLTVKLALTGVAAMAVTEGFSLLQAWWAAPISRATGLGGSVSVFSGGRFSPFVFATGGIAPVGYAAFGFALGVTAGLLIRRAVPAMALTLVIFAAVQVVMPLWVRPHLFPSDQTIAAIESTHATFSDYSHYWPLQLVETGIFLAFALALAWFCFWRLDRRVS
jgi:hypothetical protein